MEGFRRVLEVCKWLPAEVVLRTASTNSLWAKATSAEELWWELCRCAGFSVPSSEHPKDGFRRLSSTMKTLVIVKPMEIRCFNTKTKRWDRPRRTSRKMQVDEFTSSILLPDGSALSCGGSLGTPWRTAYRLSLSGEVQVLQDMLIPRGGHGLAVCGKSLYAFGGCGGNSSEQLVWDPIDTLPSRTWRRIPNMISVRCYFTPCAAEKVIYLCGGFAESCEIFNCERETYRPLAVTLPESSEVSAVLSDWEIIVLSPGYVTRLSLRSPGTISSEEHGKWSGVWGSMNSVLHSDCVYSPFDSAVQVFDLNTLDKRTFKP